MKAPKSVQSILDDIVNCGDTILDAVYGDLRKENEEKVSFEYGVRIAHSKKKLRLASKVRPYYLAVHLEIKDRTSFGDDKHHVIKNFYALAIDCESEEAFWDQVESYLKEAKPIILQLLERDAIHVKAIHEMNGKV